MLVSRRYWLLVLLWILSLATVSPYDQTLSRQLSSPSSYFGRFIQDWAAAPAYIAVAFALLARYRNPGSLWAKAVLAQGLLHSLLFTHLLKFLWGRAIPTSSSPQVSFVENPFPQAMSPRLWF